MVAQWTPTPRVALWLLIFAAALVGSPAGADSARLSWDAELRQADFSWPVGEDELSKSLYLTVETAQPVDSLGFYLRWAATGAAGKLEVTGLRPAQDAAWKFQQGQTTADAGVFERFATWLSDPDYLRAAEEMGPDGKRRYRFSLDLALSGARGFRIEAAGLTIKRANGERVRLNTPSATIGAGWTLQLPPLVTRVTGKLNWRFVRSRISLHGYDLDRLVYIVLLDNEGQRVHPVGVTSSSRERVDLNVTTKYLARGMCDIEVGGPNGIRDTLRTALEVAMLSEPQPGDDNVGVIPDTQDMQDK